MASFCPPHVLFFPLSFNLAQEYPFTPNCTQW